MEVPGLHSVFAAATLSLSGGGCRLARGSYTAQVCERDARTGRLLLGGVLTTGAGKVVSSELECFERPPLPALDSMSLLPHSPAPVTGRAVVIVGGSRGFGAAMALSLLGRGHATHTLSSTPGNLGALDRRARGATHDARRRCPRSDERCAHCRSRQDGADARTRHRACGRRPTAPVQSDPGVGGRALDYVARSVELVAAPLGAFLPLLEDDGFVLFCSSVALEAPPRDWPHYVAAKGALEGLAQWVAATRPGVRVVIARLPKLLTGMTNSPSMRLGAIAPATSQSASSNGSSARTSSAGVTMLRTRSALSVSPRHSGQPSLAGTDRVSRPVHVLQRRPGSVGSVRAARLARAREHRSHARPHRGRRRALRLRPLPIRAPPRAPAHPARRARTRRRSRRDPCGARPERARDRRRRRVPSFLGMSRATVATCRTGSCSPAHRQRRW